jgi:integrase
MVHSTVKGTRQKPSKPYPDFPLFAHATGRWAKKIRGKLAYFGKVADDPDGAAAILRYQEQRDELYAGRKPRDKTNGLTVLLLCNRFLATKEALKNDGELSPRTFHGYYRTCAMILRTFGKSRLVDDLRTEDFEAMRSTAFKGLAFSSRSVTIQLVRTVFKFAYDDGLIERPVRFRAAFKAPSAKNQQKDRIVRKDTRLLTADQIRALIDAAGIYMRAMLLLAINAGFGNHDCATLTLSDLDLDGGWHNHPRPKTGVPRRAKLWPETIEAIRAAIAKRRKPADAAYADLVFITQHGEPWVRWAKRKVYDASKSSWTDSVSLMARILFRKLGINGGASFYSLRRMTETIGGGCKDQVAVDAVMGHSRGDMASVYRLEIDDSRLEAVSDTIHAWLWPAQPKGVTHG